MVERILVPKTPSLTARSSSVSRPGIGFIRLDAIGFRLEPLVDLEEGNAALLFPQEGRDGLALRLAVHRALEEDRADHLVAREGRGSDHADPHLVHAGVHLGLAAIGALGNAVEAQSAGCRPAALVERREEAPASVMCAFML